MNISNTLIEDVVQEVAGEDILPLVNALKNKKNVSEFKLADSIKQEINVTRNMLYRLYDANLVSFTRKKDKKKGWYIYYWTFNTKNIKHLFKNIVTRKLEKLKDKLNKEKNSKFFSCDNKCMRLDFEQAIEFEFKCPECGELMNEDDNSQKIAEFEKQMKDFEKELKS